MMACRFIFIFGIIFSSVDSDSDIAPHQEEPLKKLLKRTINHVKSFLGEFEKKIMRSRLLVNEIHNQSLKNFSTTTKPDIYSKRTISFVSYPTNSLLKRAFEIRSEPIAEPGNPLKSRTAFSYQDVSHGNSILRRVDSTIKPVWFRLNEESSFQPEIFFGQIATGPTSLQKRFAMRIAPISRFAVKSSNRTDLFLNTEEGFRTEAVFLGGTAALGSNATTKHPKRLMRPGPARFQSEEEYNLYKGSIYTGNLSIGTRRVKDDLMTTKYLKPFFYPGLLRFQTRNNFNSQQGFMKPQVSKNLTNTERNDNMTRFLNPIMRQSQIEWTQLKTTNRPTYKDFKIVTLSTSTRKRDIKSNNLLTSTVQVVQPEIKNNKLVTNTMKQEVYPTLSDFYFRLKDDIISDYPDIFSKNVAIEPSALATSPISTNEQMAVLSTAPNKAVTTIIPDLTKDYMNINFRAASSSDERTEMKKNGFEENTFSIKPKRYTGPSKYTVKKIKNKK